MPQHNNPSNQLYAKKHPHYNSPSGDGGNQHHPPLGAGGNTLYHQLLAKGYAKEHIHSLFHKIIIHRAASKKAYKQLSLACKIKWHSKRYLEQVTGFFIHLTAKGLTLLKTQFAKKPKNPV